MKNNQSDFITFRITREHKLRMIDYCKQSDQKLSNLMRSVCDQTLKNAAAHQSNDHLEFSIFQGT